MHGAEKNHNLAETSVVYEEAIFFLVSSMFLSLVNLKLGNFVMKLG